MRLREKSCVAPPPPKVHIEVDICILWLFTYFEKNRWSLKVSEWLPRDNKSPWEQLSTRWADTFLRLFLERGLPPDVSSQKLGSKEDWWSLLGPRLLMEHQSKPLEAGCAAHSKQRLNNTILYTSFLRAVVKVGGKDVVHCCMHPAFWEHKP